MIPMPPTDLTPERRRELVLAAIDRIKHADTRNRETQMDASSDSDDRAASKENFAATEREFAWQWRNVEVLLRG